jgi:hypothetical protein
VPYNIHIMKPMPEPVATEGGDEEI